MGDTYQKLVPAPVSKAEAAAVAQAMLHFLIERQIILPDPIDVVLDSEEGYPPGPRYLDAVGGDPPPGLLKQTTNGVEVALGRNVFWADEPQAVMCPHCGYNMVRKKWEEAIDAWYRQTGEDGLTCAQCDRTSSVVTYRFEPVWAFGEVGLTFWNWPPLRESLIADLAQHLGRKLRLVQGEF
jgi:hypothetical protein